MCPKNSPTFTPTTCRRQARGGQPPHDSSEELFRLLFFYMLVWMAAENRVAHYAAGFLPRSLKRQAHLPAQDVHAVGCYAALVLRAVLRPQEKPSSRCGLHLDLVIVH